MFSEKLKQNQNTENYGFPAYYPIGIIYDLFGMILNTVGIKQDVTDITQSTTTIT